MNMYDNTEATGVVVTSNHTTTQDSPSAEEVTKDTATKKRIANRKRSEQIILRVTPAEKEQIDQIKSATTHRSYAGFFIDTMSSKRYVTVSSLDEVLAELKQQGNNLNQLTKMAHTAGLSEQEKEYVRKTLQEQVRTYRNLEKLANEVRYGDI